MALKQSARPTGTAAVTPAHDAASTASADMVPTATSAGDTLQKGQISDAALSTNAKAALRFVKTVPGYARGRRLPVSACMDATSKRRRRIPPATLLHMKLEVNGSRVEVRGTVRVSYPYLGMGYRVYRDLGGQCCAAAATGCECVAAVRHHGSGHRVYAPGDGSSQYDTTDHRSSRGGAGSGRVLRKSADADAGRFSEAAEEESEVGTTKVSRFQGFKDTHLSGRLRPCLQREKCCNEIVRFACEKRVRSG